MDSAIEQGLTKALDTMEDAYEEVKAGSEASVTEWRWATGKYFSLLPYEPDRFGTARGRLLSKPPVPPKNVYAFGFDAQGVLRVLRGHGKDGKPDVEQFTQVHNDGRLLVRGYLNRGRIAGQAVYIERDGKGRPLKSATLGMEGDWREETYAWQGDRVERIETTRFDALTERTSRRRVDITHAADGSASGVAIGADGEREQVFEGAPDTSV
jgi:hypothetical protein